MALASQQAVQAALIQRTVAPASVSSLGPRFQCGKLGHFRRACPLLQSATGVPKWRYNSFIAIGVYHMYMIA